MLGRGGRSPSMVSQNGRQGLSWTLYRDVKYVLLVGESAQKSARPHPVDPCVYVLPGTDHLTGNMVR